MQSEPLASLSLSTTLEWSSADVWMCSYGVHKLHHFSVGITLHECPRPIYVCMCIVQCSFSNIACIVLCARIHSSHGKILTYLFFITSLLGLESRIMNTLRLAIGLFQTLSCHWVGNHMHVCTFNNSNYVYIYIYILRHHYNGNNCGKASTLLNPFSSYCMWMCSALAVPCKQHYLHV